jgi:hypothetical protein
MEDYRQYCSRLNAVLVPLLVPDPENIYRWRVQYDCGCIEEQPATNDTVEWLLAHSALLICTAPRVRWAASRAAARTCGGHENRPMLNHRLQVVGTGPASVPIAPGTGNRNGRKGIETLPKRALRTM